MTHEWSLSFILPHNGTSTRNNNIVPINSPIYELTTLNRLITGRSAHFLAAATVLCTQLPAQTPSQLLLESYNADQQHSSVAFIARVLNAVPVSGRFTEYDATIVLDTSRPERSSVTAIIQTPSLTTDVDRRDNHLKSPDFFDVVRYPTIVFQSDRVIRAPGGYVTTGRLTMHGVTRTVAIPIRTVLPPKTTEATGEVDVAFEGELRINRKHFGIAGGNAHNPDYSLPDWMLSDNVDIVIKVSAIREGYLNRHFTGRTPPSIADTVGRTLRARGIADAIRVYQTLRAEQPKAYDFSWGELDTLAHVLTAHGKLRDAMELFKLNAATFPTSTAVAQSMAEGYMLLDDRDHALATYERALQRDSTNTDAIEMIRHLKFR